MQDTLQNETSVALAMACYLVFVLTIGVVLALVTNAMASVGDRVDQKPKAGEGKLR
jgi:hypothetical protein